MLFLFSARLKFTTKPLPTKNVDLGFSSKIHCKAAGSNRVYWVREPEDSLPDDVEDVNGTLVFNNIKLLHKGNYTCIAANDEESIKTTVEVLILPKFDVEPPKNLEVVELQQVYLDCVASGSPKPIIKWDHETNTINDGDDGRFKIFDNGTLLLNEARQDDAGIYGCIIGNSAGFKRSETMLIVKCKFKQAIVQRTFSLMSRFFTQPWIHTRALKMRIKKADSSSPKRS